MQHFLLNFLALVKEFFMRKIFFATLLLTNIYCVAQKKHTENFRVYWGLGVITEKFQNLNNRIASHPEYEQLPNAEAVFNLGWVAEADKAIIDFNMFFGGSISGDPKKKSTNIGAFGTSLNLGYNFSANKNIRFYPFASLGYQAFETRLNKDVSSIPFDSVLQSSSTLQRTNRVIFNNNFFVYKLGVGVDLLNKKDNRKGLGLRAGYAGSFTSHEWTINDTQVLSNSPNDKLDQWFFTLQFMMQRIKRNK